MKKHLLKMGAAALAVAMTGWIPQSFAQMTVTRTTSTSGGVIERFAPESELIIRTETQPDPIRYSVTRETRFVDEAGAPMAFEQIAPGVPVRVEYVQDGGSIVVSRVVVQRAAPVIQKQTTTTTTRRLSDDEKDRIEKAREAEKEFREKVREAAKERREELEDIDD